MTENLVPRGNPELLSFVIPAYNEEAVLPELRRRLEGLADDLPCRVEWVIVDDGSRDRTARLLLDWAAVDSRLKLVEFARNFGHAAALTAGLDYTTGDAVVVCDADLQDPPELVHEMLERYREGYDVVYAQRTRRHGETLFKRATAAGFYVFMRTFIHRDLPPNSGDFRLMSRDAVNAVRHMREGSRFMRGMITWIGFPQTPVLYERPPRAAGETKYPLRKMLALAWDAVLSFSNSPLRAASYFGFAVFLIGAIVGLRVLVDALFFDHNLVPGWASLIVAQCLIGGAILFCLGMIGEYVGRIYEEIKQRPIYIVRRTSNVDSTLPLGRQVGPEPIVPTRALYDE
jgi:glycosyltransferase involved in cell wall biosynthesis